MDGRTVTAVALRIWGLFLLLGAVAAAPAAVLSIRATSWGGEQMARALYAAQAPFLFQLAATAIVGLCLLLWAESVARRAIPETEPLQFGVNASQLLSIGLTLLGLFILIRGLEAGTSLVHALTQKPPLAEPGTMSYLWDKAPETMARAVVDIVVGAVLVFGRSGFGRAWAQLRSLARTGHGLTR